LGLKRLVELAFLLQRLAVGEPGLRVAGLGFNERLEKCDGTLVVLRLDEAAGFRQSVLVIVREKECGENQGHSDHGTSFAQGDSKAKTNRAVASASGPASSSRWRARYLDQEARYQGVGGVQGFPYTAKLKPPRK